MGQLVKRAELVKRVEKEPLWAYALWFGWFLGLAGIHRLYAGRWASGVLWLLTGGLCGVGQVIDLFFIPRMIDDHNQGRDVW